MNTFKGTVYRIDDVQEISEKFSKREFILKQETESRFGPQTTYAQFQLIQQRVDLIDPFKVDEEVEVNFDVEGRLWDSPEKGEVCFTNLTAWKITAAGETKSPDTPPAEKKPAEDLPPPTDIGSNNDPDDGLPF